MRTLFAVLALLVAGAVCAQGVRYRVEVAAPRDMAATLRKGLSLQRWQDDPQMTEERLRRLAAEAEREAREVAATEGYFSPHVEVRIDESKSPWSVMVKVDPGERTRVSHVEIRFSGPAAQDPEARELFQRVRERWRLRRGEAFRQSD